MTWKETILTEYSASQSLLSIIDTFNQAVSIGDFTDEFIDKVWDVTTCLSFGLDVWGKIVGVSRYINAEIDPDCFGFFEADAGGAGYPSPFNDQPFYSGIQETETVRLSDNAYRTLILCKAFSNISIATIQETNRFLTMLFKGRGRCYCINHRQMTIEMKFNFHLEFFEVSMLKNYDVIPIPSGVQVIISHL